MPIPEELKLTYKDYINLPDDGKRHEILDGEHHMTPSPQTRHQIVSRNLLGILTVHVEESGLSQVLDAPIDVLLSQTTVVQPDLLFIRKERERERAHHQEKLHRRTARSHYRNPSAGQ